MGLDLDNEEEEEEDEEISLTWSLKYVMICLLLPPGFSFKCVQSNSFTNILFFSLRPTLQGCLNGYHFSCMSLHYVDMGWPIARAGLPSAIGFGVRLLIQQIQLRLGFWVAVPLQLLHLGCAARQGSAPFKGPARRFWA